MKPPRGTAPVTRILLGLAILGLVVGGVQTVRGFGPVVAQFLVPGHGRVLAPESSGPPATLVIDNYDYTPGVLTVPAGATVEVDNQDGVIHTVTALDGSFDTGEIAGYRPGRFTAPARPGRYPYRDTVLPFMTGTLVVT